MGVVLFLFLAGGGLFIVGYAGYLTYQAFAYEDWGGVLIGVLFVIAGLLSLVSSPCALEG